MTAMYETVTTLRRQLRVRYPAGEGRMVLRTELDWDLDLEPTAVADDGETSTFDLLAHARSVVEEIKPEIDRKIRILESPRETAVVGSSLGGVVSFYMAWEYPDVFGYAACLSSTFSHKDDLIDRVLSEPKRASKFYLDSGWPGDNCEVTLAMAMALGQCGYRVREDFLHLVFPLEEHDEQAWGRRLHIPLQLGLGRVTAAGRGRLV